MFKATQDSNFNYNSKVDTSPYHFVTGQHIDMKYLHSFFAECYMFIPFKDRIGKESFPIDELSVVGFLHTRTLPYSCRHT